MIILPSANSHTFTLLANHRLMVTSRGGTTVTGLSGLLGTVNGTSTFGGYSVDTVITIAAVGNDCEFGTTEPENTKLGTDRAGNPVLEGSGLRIPLNPFLRTVGYENEQPAAIIGPVKNFGKIVTNFTTGKWAVSAGLPVATQGYTGWNGSGVKSGITSRTGQPEMLKVVPAANTTEQLTLQLPATNLLNASTAGKLGLWVYVEAQPGYQVGGTLAGGLGMVFGTSTVNMANALDISFNANQLREGWNYLKFVMRNPNAYVVGSGVVEDHPYGVNSTSYGTGADTNIVANPIAKLTIQWSNMLGSTLYFDSIWTGFDTTAQVVLGNDGGPGLTGYALPVFNDYRWKGYFALPYNTADTGFSTLTVQSNLSSYPSDTAAMLYAAGWDCVNHSVTHPSTGGYTSEANIVYQILQAQAMMSALGFQRGTEFYASPQSNSSRLSEAVIKTTGIKLQRHLRKSNTSVTQFGIDNPHHVGSMDIGSSSPAQAISHCTGGVNGSTGGMQIFTKIKRAINVFEAYGDTIFLFWHGIVTTGDTGTGETLTGDGLLMTKSAFEISMAYIRARELAGGLTVTSGITGFWYGA